MGNGRGSFANIGVMYSILGEAFSILNDIQQPPMSTDPPMCDKKISDRENAEIRLFEIAKQIHLGLTGLTPKQLAKKDSK